MNRPGRRKSIHCDDQRESESNKMTKPGKRKSIHHDDQRESESNEDILKRCDKCQSYYLIHMDGTSNLLHEANLNELEERKNHIYKVAPFTCMTCDATGGREDPDSGTRPELLSTWDFASKNWFRPNMTWITAVILVIAIAILVVPMFHEYFFNQEKSFEVNMHQQTSEEELLENEIYKLDQTYQNQGDKLWDTLVAGIKSVQRSRPTMPSVFMMLYDSTTAGETAKCLAKDVSKFATKFLMGRQKSPVIVDGGELGNDNFLMEDPGRLLVKFNSTVRNQGVMIVTNLQNLNPTLATSFHFFCDSYSPLVEKAVFFLMLKVDYLPKSKLTQAAEQRLKELWSQMADNLLEPLITRMTTNVVGVYRDSTSCS